MLIIFRLLNYIIWCLTPDKRNKIHKYYQLIIEIKANILLSPASLMIMYQITTQCFLLSQDGIKLELMQILLLKV